MNCLQRILYASKASPGITLLEAPSRLPERSWLPCEKMQEKTSSRTCFYVGLVCAVVMRAN